MKIEIGYGQEIQAVEVPDNNLMGVMYGNQISVDTPAEEILRRAIHDPVQTKPLQESVQGRHQIVIITSDITRPTPSAVMLPVVLDELRLAGVADEEITIVFAIGSHRKQTPEEMRSLVGAEIFNRLCCIDADETDVVHMGTTSHGTPVDITRVVAEADYRLCLGNVEFHWFAGYSGGAKAVMPGVSTRAAIQVNHRLLTEPGAVARNLESPVRRDLEESIRFCPIDFIVNVVLDEHKKIVYAAAGHFIGAHRDACRFLDRMYTKPISQPADIVIVSQGGAPKDLNLYQMQKALDNARYAVKKDGIIIWAGCAREGLGGAVFEQWMLAAENPDAIIERIGREFCLGGHKAAAIALTLKQARIFLVSEIEADLVRKLFMRPFTSIQSALDEALLISGTNARVLVMPYGGSTLPVIDMDCSCDIV